MILTGKTVLVTGAAIRLGRHIAQSLAEAGCNIAIHYHQSKQQAEGLKASFDNSAIKAEIFHADLEDMHQVNQLMAAVGDAFGYVDVLINNAARYLRGNAQQTTPEIWESQFKINLQAPFFLSLAFKNQLPNAVNGKIINITDAQIHKTITDHFAYRLTKHNLAVMTKMLAKEFAPQITVNALALGLILPLADRPEIDLSQLAKDRVPMQVPGSPKMVADAILYLLQQDFITGEIINIDGGESL